jgi:hypothetical protein
MKEKQMKHVSTKALWCTLAPSLFLVTLTIITGCGGGSTTPNTTTIDPAMTDGDPITRSVLGSGIPGLSATEASDFTVGAEEFAKVETADDGIGPVFNGTSCAECHKAGAVGGAGFDKTVSIVRRIGAMQNGQYTDLVEKGGPVLQRRSINEFDPTINVQPEVVPAEAQFVSHRMTTPLFGAGLIEAIPDATLEALADPNDKNGDGISGRVNHVYNPETNRTEVGKFGWKAQVSTLSVFAGDAYLNEMGITTPFFQHENLPQGQALPGDADKVPDPEDDAVAFTHFMKFLAPPHPSREMPDVPARWLRLLPRSRACNGDERLACSLEKTCRALLRLALARHGQRARRRYTTERGKWKRV